MIYRTDYGDITIEWTEDEKRRLDEVLVERDQRRANPPDPQVYQLYQRDRAYDRLPAVLNGVAVDWRESLRLGPRGATELKRFFSDSGNRIWRRDLTVKEFNPYG